MTPEYNIKDIAHICGGQPVLSAPLVPIRNVSIDTREIDEAEESLFIAIQSDNRDGHRYIAEAVRKGVTQFLVSSNEGIPEGVNYTLVKDTVEALQAWATHHRNRFDIPVIGITGSNGKTIVKEWLASVLEPHLHVAKSPKSYNSQIGVPLSVLEMNEEHEIAIFEAGISQKGEMERLARIIRPNIGIMTHFGDAHDEGFESAEEKLDEKLKLFKGCTKVIVGGQNHGKVERMRSANLNVVTAGGNRHPDLQLFFTQSYPEFAKLRIGYHKEEVTLQFPFKGPANYENILLVILAARELGISFAGMETVIRHLSPVSMRLELITDNPEITIINDAYNADAASISSAFSKLEDERDQAGGCLILTDLEHQGKNSEAVHQKIFDDAARRFGESNIIFIGPVFARIGKDKKGVRSYLSTDDLIKSFEYRWFRNKTVLLKGARKFGLERLIPFLSRRVNSTYVKINLSKLSNNFRLFRRSLPQEVKVMAMVKAFSYGSGTWEIASELAREGTDYFAVAYLSEGIELRTRGIVLPIMVMNPDPEGLDQLYTFNLEPEIYSLDYLKKYYEIGEAIGKKRMPLHLKVDTGMHRLGFYPKQVKEVRKYLEAHPELEVVSVFTHLAAADDPKMDSYSFKQIETFKKFADKISKGMEHPPMRHVLNSSGILRFGSECMDMVRLGIAIYGIAPADLEVYGLEEVGSLRTTISQIKAFPKGTPIGYGLSEKMRKDGRVATIPIGYADGIPRALSNGKISFLVNGKLAPTMGKVCMDMIMLDITDIPDAKEGDEVVLFGEQGGKSQSVIALAKAAGTIPYEILAGISQRVRRVFVKE